MTAAQLASLLHARRIGKGRWVARCPAHPDRNPSLAVAIGKSTPVVLKCMSAGCDIRSILAALGLSFRDLYDRPLAQGNYAAIEAERERQRRLEDERKALYDDLCQRARFWENQAAQAAKFMAENDAAGDMMLVLFNSSLRKVRILNSALCPGFLYEFSETFVAGHRGESLKWAQLL